MLAWLARRQARPPRPGRRRARPALEALETRNLLSGMADAEFWAVSADALGPDGEAACDVLIGAPVERPDGPVPDPGDAARVLRGDGGPVIAAFEAIQEEGPIFTFRGQVLGDQVAGLDLRLGGLPSLATARTTVSAGGWFQLTVRLQPGEEGTAVAQTTDLEGRDSNRAMALVRQG